jgi:oxygen-independent coproporphyrinogen-3 oxidase
MKIKPDDVIRREVIRHIRTFFNIEFSFFDKKYPHKFKDYFQNELKNLKNMESDGLLKINEDNVMLTPLGEHFSPQIANVFDVYNDQEFYKRAI